MVSELIKNLFKGEKGYSNEIGLFSQILDIIWYRCNTTGNLTLSKNFYIFFF